MAATMEVEQLTPLDLLMPKTYIATVLTFRTTEQIAVLSPALQAGLDGLRQRVPWLSGRVYSTSVNEGQKAGLEIRWDASNDALALLDKGTISAEYESMSVNGMPPAQIPTDVWPAPSMIDDSLSQSGAPVFAASIFRFANNKGVGLCVCMHHNAVDATGFAEVLRLWSESIAGAARAPLPVSTGRAGRLSHGLSPEIRGISTLSLDALFASHPEYSRIPPTLPASFPTSTCKLFTFPVSRILAAKERLSKNKRAMISANTVLCAIVWSAVAGARQQRDPGLSKETSRLVTAVNGRPRIAENFSTRDDPFLGNAVLYSLTQLDAGALGASTAPLENICEAISQSQSSRKINSRHIAEVHSLVESMEDYRGIFPGWDLFNTRDLTITSWADLGLYDIEFGEQLGMPEFARVRYTEADGVAIILPKRKETKRSAALDTPEEVFEVMLMLRADDMKLLEQDSTWKSFTL